MWFAALGSYHHNPWFVHLAYKLLRPDAQEVHELLDAKRNNMTMAPTAVQAWLYQYDFTRWALHER